MLLDRRSRSGDPAGLVALTLGSDKRHFHLVDLGGCRYFGDFREKVSISVFGLPPHSGKPEDAGVAFHWIMRHLVFLSSCSLALADRYGEVNLLQRPSE